MNDLENIYIEHCKNLLEKKLNIGSSEQWKQRDFEFLCDKVFEKTNVLLSLSTAKRLWSQKYKKLPHPSTLNALANFIDYENWQAFKQSVDVSESKNHIETKKSVKKSSVIFKQIGFLCIFLIIAFTIWAGRDWFTTQNFADEYKNITFSSKKTVISGVPNTVIFDYDIPNVSVDSAFIQQTWDPKRRAKINIEKHKHTSIYFYPGHHKAKLVLNDQIVKELDIQITTDGWLGIITTGPDDEIPSYVPQTDILKNNQLYISPDVIQKLKIDVPLKNYYTVFYNVRDFGEIYTDNFTIETEIKNSLQEGGLTCQHCGLIVMPWFSILLTQPGCVNNAGIHYMKTRVSGVDNDLSALGCDFSDWQKLRIEVKNKNANIFINDNRVYHISSNENAGKIIGLQYVFFGSGSVNYVKLFDKNEQLVYSDSFE